ncbi:Transcription factor [Aspergillus sclerotialis]|uniref:Transcription factor n=1 Tax=Aspergillus sclerotialis TaxID=2070753 RepID=A0A3A2Z7D1_9EURO|nr:Transcription factor [Aspergillus sclerotialis]
MPRTRVAPPNRRRVVRACDVCRKRKEKCDGNLPCSHCTLRNKGDICRYGQPYSPSSNSRIRSTGSRTSVRPRMPRRPANPLPQGSSVSDNYFAEEDALLGLSGSADPAIEHNIVDSALIPKQSRMLPDAKGKLIYIGQSASLSYLHIVQRVAADCIGSCAFTDDPQQQCIVEKDIPGYLGSYSEPEPELELALALAEQYALTVSGVFDFFDLSDLQAAIVPWVADSNRRDRPDTPVIFLALAIGALGCASNDEEEALAERYFNYGRQQAVIHLMHDPCLSTVIAFSLMSYYMLASCRLNGAFTYLGIAARAAYTLGIHRHETNRAFGDAARGRAWKSLRVCDLFLSASTGRPAATSEVDCNIPWSRDFNKSPDNIDPKEDSPLPSQEDSAIFRICLVFERILVEVFSRREVSLELARSISQQHRQWTEELPTMLKIDGFLGNETSPRINIQKLGTHLVAMAYYYSIILLCRPFLSFHIGTRLKKTGSPQDPNAVSDSITTYADACIDSAIHNIALAEDIAFDESMPNRQPIIINAVFISALCLGHASFGDYDQRGWPINCNMDMAISILRKLSVKNPQAVRYTEICCHMKEAIGAYVHRRADTLLKSPSMNVRNVFGDVQAIHISRPHLSNENATTSGTRNSDCGGRDPIADAQSKAMTVEANSSNDIAPPDYNLVAQSSTVAPDSPLHFTGQPHSHHHQSTEHVSPLSMGHFAFSDSLPLFSLTDEFGPSLSADQGVLFGEMGY